MTNILFIHSSSELYGSDRSLLNIVKNIDKKQYNVFVILPCYGPLVYEMKKIDGIKVEIFEVAVLRRKNLSIKGGIEYIRNFKISYVYIKEFIKKNRIDIVDTNTAVVFQGAIAAKKMGVKSVWHIREIINSKLENKVISLIMQKFANLIIANSKATGKALDVSQDKIRVVYNAVEEMSIDVENKACSQLTIGMAGRINRWKGQKLLVDAALIVHERFPEAIFHIAGDAYLGEEYLEKDLQEYIDKKGLTDTVFLLGQVTNMCQFYSSLDIFVLPSTQPEPFGLVVIEAMEFSLPVIATNHGGPKEIIDNGVDGYLVDHNNCFDLAHKLMELLSDEEKRKKMGKLAKDKKRRLFSVTTMVEGIEAVFDEVINV